jgi:hypothetical protein
MGLATGKSYVSDIYNLNFDLQITSINEMEETVRN